jgi:hypothetical protein
VNVLRGKVLLVVTRLDSKWVPFEVQAYVQSCNHPEGYWDADIDFGLLDTEQSYICSRVSRMQVGECLRLTALYETIHHHDGFTGEWDADLILSKVKVRRAHKQPNFYVSKAKQ